ncbi:hypothetical protein, partial [Oscillatoria sp. HE19RPO]|uniref:hypothetical protein n=1 Tax=Oscillatoria sp. HE19RPO TaxID=2954806 RepID=UPI0020C1F1EE
MLAPLGRKHCAPTNQYTLTGLVYKNPHPEGWGYTDEARLRGLKAKTDFYQPDLVLNYYQGDCG